MSVTTHPLTPATDPDWYRDHSNLCDLWRWLDERGEAPDDPAYFLEKPYKWTREWRLMHGDAS